MTRRSRPATLAAVLASVLVSALAACTGSAGSPIGSSPLPDPTQPATTQPATTQPATSPPTPAAPSSPATQAPDPDLATRCAAVTAKLDLEQQVGQLFMAAVPSTGVGDSARRTLRRAAVGSVLLLGNTEAGADAVADVSRIARRAAGAQGGVGPLLAADQEGGQVQRLQGDGFSRIPSALEQANLSDAELARNATRWGRQLQAAGIDVDLAPVADLVPDDLLDVNRPIGVLQRGYGSDPDVIAAKVSAFVRGMDAAGVATALKHFPGLGRVRGNTDFEADVVDRQTRPDDAGMAGFRAGVAAGADLVMVASARYTRIDPERRAAFSPVVMDLIRDDLEFDGVIISDDLSAAAFEDVRVRDRALRFFRAGGDLAIVGDLTELDAMTDAVADEAEDDPAFAKTVVAAANRVVTLKARRGHDSC